MANVRMPDKRTSGRLPTFAASFWRVVRYNPIIQKELRYRMRGWRGLVNLSFYTLMLTLFATLSYIIFEQSNRSYTGNPFSSSSQSYAGRSQEIGSGYFLSIIIAQLFLICILAPGLSAGTIAREKERKTYDVLLITMLKPVDIVIGKLVASLAYLLTLVVAGLPVASVAFLMGGVGLDQLIVALVIMVVTSIMLGSIGIFWSSISRTGQRANRAAFWSTLILLFGLPVIGLFFLGIIVEGYATLYLSSSRFVDNVILTELEGWLGAINPIYTLFATYEILNDLGDRNFFFYILDPDKFLTNPLIRFLVIYTGASAFFTWMSIQRVKPQKFGTDAVVLSGSKPRK